MTTRPTRRFVPADVDFAKWGQLAPLFDALDARPIESPADLERWLADYEELLACFSEYEARAYIDMTCHTDDPAIERRYLHLVEQIRPSVEPRLHALKRRYLATPFRDAPDRRRFEVFDRQVEAEVALFRAENVPLQAELATLDQRYDKLSGAMTVEFRGEERTIPQMGRFQEDPDRAVREAAWTAVAERRLRDREAIEAVFDEMLELRRRVADQAGLPGYRAYAWVDRGRFDYTPEDCLRFHDAVAEVVVPLRDRLGRRRRAALGVERLRPWDLAVDPAGRERLRPFEDAERLCDGVETIFGRLEPDFGVEFRRLRERRALDVESRVGKAPGGYQYTLDEIREPFIFMNAAGLQRDVETLLHEGGHALHAAATRDLPLWYRHPPLEYCEVASMAMEHFGRPHLDVFYGPEDAARAARKHLEDVVALMTWIATIDGFQHWLYTHPGHSRDERRAAWVDLLDRFYHEVDWTGHEAARDAMWQRQSHLFGSPFYYIEYAIAQLGALQLWLLSRLRGEGHAIASYRRSLALGGSRPLPELFEAADIRFDLSERTLRPVMEAVAREVDLPTS